MDNLMKRRINDCRRRVEKNRTKFISMYVEAHHGKIYREAERVYDKIRRNNPNKKDLTKTLDFMVEVMPDKPVPRYYKTEKNTQQESLSKPALVLNTQQESLSKPALVLNTQQESLSKPALVLNTQQENLSKPALVLNIPLMGKTTVDQIMSASTTTTQEETVVVQPPLDIPDAAYAEMIEEIRKDPHLSELFNEINTQGYSPESNDYFVADQDISPLEIELA